MCTPSESLGIEVKPEETTRSTGGSIVVEVDDRPFVEVQYQWEIKYVFDLLMIQFFNNQRNNW